MAIIQPLYYPYGRYTADTDRILATALIDAESDKTRIGGVLPPTTSMAVSVTSGRTIAVSPGLCVIPDVASPAGTTPGIYIAGIEGSSFSFDLPNVNGTYYIYAEVDDSIGATITNKEANGSTATLTTSAAHGFSVGETVQVVGVDTTFDGTYTITAVTTSPSHTFSYTKAATVSSAADTGEARVPFSVRGSVTNPVGSKKALVLATSVVSGGSAATPVDKRVYAAAAGGVHLYNSNTTATAPAGTAGRLRFDTYTNSLQVYDTSTSAWKTLYSAADGGAIDTDTATTSIHHTLGSGQYQAAAGNHTHDSRYASKTQLPDYDYGTADVTIPYAASGYGSAVEFTFLTQTSTKQAYYLVNFTAAVRCTNETGGIFLSLKVEGNLSGVVTDYTDAGPYTLYARFAGGSGVTEGQNLSATWLIPLNAADAYTFSMAGVKRSNDGGSVLLLSHAFSVVAVSSTTYSG